MYAWPLGAGLFGSLFKKDIRRFVHPTQRCARVFGHTSSIAFQNPKQQSLMLFRLAGQLEEVHIDCTEPKSNFAIGEVVLPHASKALIETERLNL